MPVAVTPPGGTRRGSPRRLGALLTIAAATASCDQSSKSVIFERLAENGSSQYLGGLLRLHLVHNRGGFLGLGESLHPTLRFWLFTLGVSIALAAVVYVALTRRLETVNLVGLGLILGGGVGNLLDRIHYSGVVRDFAIVGVGPVRTGVFNLADVAIMAGAGLLLTESWWRPAGDPATRSDE